MNMNIFLKGGKMKQGKVFLRKVCSIRRLLVFMFLIWLMMFSAGCATVMTGKYQDVPVTSEPVGVKVRADTGEMILTPGKFHLIRNETHTLVAEYAGHEPQQLKLHNKAQGWVWGNILLGGGIGLIVDCASGASDELIPKEVHFNFINPELTTREATKDKKEDKKVASSQETQVKEGEKEETEVAQYSGENKLISSKEYADYQKYVAEKEKNESEESEGEKQEFGENGCPALMNWLADELGVDQEQIKVFVDDTFAYSTDIQPCEVCARLKDASIILEDPEATNVAALVTVVNEFVTTPAPPSEEQMASIDTAFADHTDDDTYYAAAGQWIDALVEYVSILSFEMGYSPEEASGYANKYIAPVNETGEAAAIAFVQARLAAIGG